ncbi:sigma-70 family RNA polymerase sigma factor [Francisellaceae bacterium]|nr:sigma-70 family RNA polymerase sigma factor [Francisellaceae bacterium]
MSGESTKVSESPSNLQESMCATEHYLHTAGIHDLMTKEEEIECARACQAGSRAAFNKMVEKNLRLVIKVAKPYKPKGAMTFLDLVAEGNLGLIRAVEGFNPDLGWRFSTYAVWWIRQSIERAIMNHNRTIRIPVHVLKDLNTYNKAVTQLTEEIGQAPSPEAVAEFLDRPIEDIRFLINQTKDSCSLDELTEVHDNIYTHSVSDDNIQTPVSMAEESSVKKLINQWLDILNENQKKVLMMRYGLNGYDTHSLDECGRELKVSRERCRQIQFDALKKIHQHVASSEIAA